MYNGEGEGAWTPMLEQSTMSNTNDAQEALGDEKKGRRASARRADGAGQGCRYSRKEPVTAVTNTGHG